MHISKHARTHALMCTCMHIRTHGHMSGGLFSHVSVSGLSVCMPASYYRVSVYSFVCLPVYTLRYACRHVGTYARTFVCLLSSCTRPSMSTDISRMLVYLSVYLSVCLFVLSLRVIRLFVFLLSERMSMCPYVPFVIMYLVCRSLCMPVCLSVRIHVYICMYVCMYTCTQARTHEHVFKQMGMSIRIYLSVCK